MSSLVHPKFASWQRDPHTGQYQRELHGWTLRTRWAANRPERRGYFTWEAVMGEGEQQSTQHSEEHFEELELCMSDAERFAREDAALKAYLAAARAEASAGGSH